VISELLVSILWMLDWQRPIYRTVFTPLASPVNASLLWAVSYTLLMLLIAWVMYRSKVFIKV
jgi:predicted acyltransferase